MAFRTHLLKLTAQNQTVAACLSYVSLLFGLWMVLTGSVSAWWLLATFVVYMAMQLSVTVGCHRLFTHRTFECHRAWHWVFSTFATLSCQASAVSWVHVHYTHHKYSDTDQDPHITDWSFLFWKRNTAVSGKYLRVVARLIKDPVHKFLHEYAVLFILSVACTLALIDPLLLLFGLAMPVGYYFVTCGLHQILSHGGREPKNLPWMELAFPMGEWLHAEHHRDASRWDFGAYDIGSCLIRWIKK